MFMAQPRTSDPICTKIVFSQKFNQQFHQKMAIFKLELRQNDDGPTIEKKKY